MNPDQRLVAGRYRLLSRLGSGGMGTVWRAEDEVLGREVAVKEVTFPQGLSDEDREVLRERTRREARAAARLDHPSAVTVYDVVEDGGAPYLVMELVEAPTLSQVVRAEGPLTPQRTAEVGLALLGALEAAHRRGILHRDVKPGNVLLCPDPGGRVVLTDFGIASSVGDSSLTSTGLLLGSPSYIAPERAKGQAPGPASDLWSLGATLFTAVEGRPPYDGGEPMLTVTAVVTGEHAPFVAAGPLEPVLEGLLAREPGERLTAAQARARLSALAAGTDPDTAPVPAPAPAPEAERRTEHTTVLPMTDLREAAAAAPAAPASQAVRPLVRPSPRRPPLVVDDRPRPRSRTPLLLAAGLCLVLAAGLGLALTADRPDRPGGTAAGASPQAAASPPPDAPSDAPSPARSAPPSPAGTPAGAAAAGVRPVPEGWQRFTGGPGWVAAVPPGYRAGTFAGSPQYRDPATGRTLRVSTSGPGGGKEDAVQDREEQAASFARRHPDYAEIDISSADYRGYEAADWEFTYSSGGTPLHVINRVFVVGGRGYSLFFQTRASDDWAAARRQFDQIAASFRPA